MPSRLFASTIALTTLCFATLTAHATTVCVTNASELNAKLHEWESADTDLYTIKVAQGTYPIPTSQGNYFGYDSGASLRLLGGYYTYNGDPCGKRHLNATNTVVQGNPADVQSTYYIQGFGPELKIEGITFRSFGTQLDFGTDGYTTISSIIVTDVHEGYGYPALWLNPQGGQSITLQNSLIYGNSANGGVLAGDDLASGSSSVYLINNTIVQNAGVGVTTGTSARPTDALVVGFNNIIWGNTGIGFKTTYANSPPVLIDTLVDTTLGSFDVAGTLLTHADPKFTAPGANPPNFTLQTNSPAINVGAPEYIVGGYTTYDLVGNARITGSSPIDLGAYESAVDNLTPQNVTKKTDDNSVGTLRSAITAANNDPDATTIRFNVTGTCPQVITLSASVLLPDITTDVTIDGYTEPNSAANSDSSGYDGAICIVVRGTLAHALRVTGSGRLTVKGIEFEGFTNAAVRLSAGSNNQVVGNAFSAFPGSAPNVEGVLIDGTAKNSVVGWTDPPEHNVFDQSTAAAIEISGTTGGHYLFGNYIGFALDGSNWSGVKNLNGIQITGSGGNRIENNVIGNSPNYGMFLTGPNTAANAINYNAIGVTPFTRVPAGNGNAGIAFANGAHNNRIGPAPGSTAGGQNEIRNNGGPGIWLKGAGPEGVAGDNNRINGNNTVYNNNGLLAIDIGAGTDAFGLGPTADDSGDADVGPNRIENYPYLTQAMRFEADKIALDGYFLTEFRGTGQTYRLDVFWTDSCVGSGASNDTPRGEMKRYIGALNVAVPSGTYLQPFPYTTITAPRSIPGTGFLFAIATDGAGNTSEPGPCEPFVDDYLFTNGFEH